MSSGDDHDPRYLHPHHKQISTELDSLRKRHANLERKFELLKSDNEILKAKYSKLQLEIRHQKTANQALRSFRSAVKRELERSKHQDDASSQYSSFDSDGETASYSSGENLRAYSPPSRPQPPKLKFRCEDKNSVSAPRHRQQPFSAGRLDQAMRAINSHDSEDSTDSLKVHHFKRQHVDSGEDGRSQGTFPPPAIPMDAFIGATDSDDDQESLPPPAIPLDRFIDAADSDSDEDSLPPPAMPLDELTAVTDTEASVEDDLPPPAQPFSILLENAVHHKETIYCVCRQAFSTKIDVDRHMNTSQLGCRAYRDHVLSLIPYRCHVCEKPFVRRQALFAHMKHMKHEILAKPDPEESSKADE